MNESLDSISSFFNKLLNIKPKDSARETNRSHSLPSDPTSSGTSTMNRPKQKTTSKATISFLKAGLSDILDETSGYLAGSTGRTSPGQQATSSKASNPLESVQAADNVQVAIDLTNEPDVKCLLNETAGCSDRVPARKPVTGETVGEARNVAIKTVGVARNFAIQTVGNARNSAETPRTTVNIAESPRNAVNLAASPGYVKEDGTVDKCADRPTGNDSSDKLEIKTKLDGNGNLANERKAKIADRLAKEPAERMLSVDRVNESSTVGKTLNGPNADRSDRTEAASQKTSRNAISPTANLQSENQKQVKKQGENRSSKSDKTSSELSDELGNELSGRLSSELNSELSKLSNEPKSDSEPTKAEQSNASNEVSTNKLNCKLNSEERSAAQSDRSSLPEDGLAAFVPPALFGTGVLEEINLDGAPNESPNGSGPSLATENRPEESSAVCPAPAPEEHSPATDVDRSGLTGEENDENDELVSTFNTSNSVCLHRDLSNDSLRGCISNGTLPKGYLSNPKRLPIE